LKFSFFVDSSADDEPGDDSENTALPEGLFPGEILFVFVSYTNFLIN